MAAPEIGATGSTSVDTQSRIAHATRFGQQAEALVVNRKECPSGKRNNLLLAYWSLVFDFDKGILCLLAEQHYGSAFALVRPMIEATIRAYVVIMGSDDEIEAIRRDEYKVNFTTIGPEIDKAFGLYDFFEKFLENSERYSIATPMWERFSLAGDLTASVLRRTTRSLTSPR